MHKPICTHQSLNVCDPQTFSRSRIVLSSLGDGQKKIISPHWLRSCVVKSHAALCCVVRSLTERDAFNELIDRAIARANDSRRWDTLPAVRSNFQNWPKRRWQRSSLAMKDDARTRAENEGVESTRQQCACADDFMAGFDQLERDVRQYHAVSGKHIDEDTMSGVILGILAKNPTEKHRDLAHHLVLDGYRLDSYDKMFVEIREIQGTKKYMNQESAINTVSEAKGTKGKKGDSKWRVTIKFAGNCWVCGKSQATRNKIVGTTRAGNRRPKLQRSRMVTDKSLKCEHCGLKCHRRRHAAR